MSKKTDALSGENWRKIGFYPIGICLLLLAGIYLRIVFITYGLPYVPNGDETINFNVINGMVQGRELNPGFFRYPSLLFNLNLPSLTALNHLVGPISDVDAQAIGTGFLDNSSALILVRCTSVILGTGSIAIVIWILFQITRSTWTSALGGIFLAFSPLSVRHAAYFTPDVPATFFVTGCVAASLMIIRNPVVFWYIVAGVCAGLAASTKYNSGLVVITLIFSHLVVQRGSFRGFEKILAAALASIFALIAASPYLVLDFGAAWSGLSYELSHYKTGHPGAEGDSFVKNVGWLFEETGWTIVLLLPAILYGDRKFVWPIVGFVICYFMLLSIQNVRFERNILPIIPCWAMLASIGAQNCYRWLSKVFGIRAATQWSKFTFGLLPLLLFHDPIQKTWNQFQFYDRDPRAAERLWLETRLPDNGHIIVDAYTPYLQLKQRKLVSYPFLLNQDVDALSEGGYAVLTKRGSGRFIIGDYKEQMAVFSQLSSMACEIDKYPDEQTLPEITVFRFGC